MKGFRLNQIFIHSLKAATASILLLGGQAISAPQTDDTQPTTKPASEECYLQGISERLTCGWVQVPENYSEPEGKQIGIHYAVLPAVQAGGNADPLVILAGGPGQAATELAAMMNRMFNQVRQQRDILLIDQRGTGQSNPLGCELEQADQLILSDDEVDLAAMTKACLADYPDTDVTQYHTVNAIRDFEAVRSYLGYETVNLYGGSYGTRAGLTYLREAPDAVRSVVLDAVAPNQVVIGPFGRHGAASFDRLLQGCAADEVCSSTFPDLGATYQELVGSLSSEPIRIEDEDPLTNEPIELLLTAGRFTSIVRVALYHPSTRQLLPYMITETQAGNYQPLMGLMGSLEAQSPLYLGLTLSVLCSEDMARATPELMAEDADNDFIGGRTGEAFAEMCSAWPTVDRDASWAEPVESDKPVLLLSGENDPVTPVAWGDLAAESLPNSRHLVAPFGAHTIASHTCANRLIGDFLNTLELADLDASCLSEQQRELPFIYNSNAAGM